MELDNNDVIKFYELYSRYDPVSRNIGIIGSYRKFKQYMQRYLEYYNQLNAKIIINTDKTKYTIMVEDIEYTFIYIQNTFDLKGYKFSKFI